MDVTKESRLQDKVLLLSHPLLFSETTLITISCFSILPPICTSSLHLPPIHFISHLHSATPACSWLPPPTTHSLLTTWPCSCPSPAP